ncbi:cAMP-responsive element modulator-like isoform X2 [Cottoperca gobio]|uniref:cAMP-responsive element modulator-like isoform X2 n=1 Tax=Cottoperca gobio TaxID=56716 RepID=A0A6J2RGS9_COTGO|nr:cAMP-responsive element modulator-like isoform X2 [Cottoperca gobio]
MDTSVSPELDSSFNDSVTDGEDDHSEDSPPPAAPLQVSPGVTVVQLCDGQTVQVPQTSVIQSPQVQTVQIARVAELQHDESVADTQQRRALLSRRPSYRKILNELSSDSPAVPKIDEEKMEEEEEEAVSSAASAPAPTSIYQTDSGQYPATGDIPAYQLRSPNSGLSHSIVMAASPGSMQSPSHHTENITRKREVRLMKNREAARECRRKKKEYVKCLENRVAVLENQNKTLIEELKALKDIYCHKAE